MKSGDRAMLIGFVLVGVLAAFWFLVLSPKRDEVSTLDTEISEVRTSLDEQRQLLAAGQQAREDYDSNYHRLVVLGKAVPAGDDAASLFVQLDDVAERSKVGFNSIVLNEGGGEAPVPAAGLTTADAPAPAEGEAAPAETPPPAEGTETAAPAGTPVVATEANAAGLPIGASVGSAGLPTMPYSISVSGDFFKFADFLAGIDRLVGSEQGRPAVEGRLITIDGFSLVAGANGFPALDANVAVTTFVTPADQGLTAGGTPTAPPASPSAVPTPASTTTPAPAP